ncbi:chemosensory receptor b [Plakobranchus ocellatus]|uniref:Chemosensory receptor b n=1 Tax=Plakobranchus ocellatus TaxID=259542 RepID=A0AAV3ZJK7_9GAST|nr:chemosensory receptor b [Plakobranchus ocellatus]
MFFINNSVNRFNERGLALDFIPRSGYHKFEEQGSLVDDALRDVFIYITYVGLCGSMAVGGIVGNILNIAVYWKHGFGESITVSLFALSVSDLCVLILFLWTGICLTPGFSSVSDTAAFVSELHFVVGGSQRMTFIRISLWIMVLIAAERCTGIMKPHNVKQVFTPVRSLVAILVISGVLVLSALPVYLGVHVGTRFSPTTNNTRLTLLRSHQLPSLSRISIVIAGLAQFLSIFCILASNSFLLLALRNRRKRWRARNIASSVLYQQERSANTESISVIPSQQSSCNSNTASENEPLSAPDISGARRCSLASLRYTRTNQRAVSTQQRNAQSLPSSSSTQNRAGGSSDAEKVNSSAPESVPAQAESSSHVTQLREIHLTSAAAATVPGRKQSKMVLILSAVTLVCFLPGVAMFCAILLEPKFGLTSRYGNLARSLWGFVSVLEVFNASINIAVYYNMSSRYKQTLRTMLGLNRRTWFRRARVGPIATL